MLKKLFLCLLLVQTNIMASNTLSAEEYDKLTNMIQLCIPAAVTISLEGSLYNGQEYNRRTQDNSSTNCFSDFLRTYEWPTALIPTFLAQLLRTWELSPFKRLIGDHLCSGELSYLPGLLFKSSTSTICPLMVNYLIHKIQGPDPNGGKRFLNIGVRSFFTLATAMVVNVYFL